MRYWLHWHNIKHEICRRFDMAILKLATKLPGQLRMWVVVDSANTAIFDLYPRADGYAGPDGLTFKEIYDGACRSKNL